MNNEDLATRQGIDRTAYATLEQIRQRIIQAIDSAPGVGNQYENARNAYADMTRQMVAPVEQALGPLMRINPQQGTLLTKAGQAVLNPAERSPEIGCRSPQRIPQRGTGRRLERRASQLSPTGRCDGHAREC